ncbi:MAG: nitronate monooxygenase [Clostridiales bacterium]|nr:nitronate monooxygenase [Clostridiales bacterium]
MIRTPICDLLGIEYPVFQGGMAWIADGKLAAAVSEAGGLGIIAAGNASAEAVREQIRYAREHTDKPFGVNIMLMSPHAQEVAELAAAERVAAVTTGAGDPGKYMRLWNDAGIRVMPVVASVALAKRVARMGASAVIAEGGESGGHVGDLTTMALVPQVCDAVDIPVVAAGGIADGRQMAAALLLGAVGVQMGTRFLTCTECSVHPTYKEKILKATDISTVVTGKRLGHPVRSIKTPFSRMCQQAEYSAASDEELHGMTKGALRRAALEGDSQNGIFLAGQVAAMVTKEQPAAEIIREVVEGAEQVLKGADRWLA